MIDRSYERKDDAE
jgi:hypothetical protein